MNTRFKLRLKPGLASLVTLLLAASFVSACGGDDESSSSTGGDAAAQEADAGTTEAGAAVETQDIDVLLSFPRAILWSPLLVAEDQGFFDDLGLNVNVEETEGSGFVTQQIIAGNSDFGWAGAPSDVIAYGEDESLRALACNNARNIFTLGALPDSGITSVEDLAGKKIGITAKGGGEEPMLMSTLEDAGLTDDVEIIPLGEVGPALLRALQNGTVDAFAGGVTDNVTLEAEGVTLTDITPEKFDPMPGDCLVTSSDALADADTNAAAVKLIQAWTMGAFFTIANPDAALDIACEAVPESCQDREGFAKPMMARVVELLQPVDKSLPSPVSIDPNGWQVTADVLAESGALDAPVDTTDLVSSPEGVKVQEDAYANIDELKATAEEAAAAYSAG